MASRIFNPWEDEADRCVIGRHKVDSKMDMLVMVEGKPLCRTHALEIVATIDKAHSHTVTRHRIIDAYNRHHIEDEKQKREDEMRRIADSRAPGFVYYIRMDNLIKIGYAKDVSTRMRAYPPTAELLAVHPGTKQVEREMHQQFHAFLRRGREWFEPHDTVMRHIDGVREKFGDPTRFAYQYRKVG